MGTSPKHCPNRALGWGICAHVCTAGWGLAGVSLQRKQSGGWLGGTSSTKLKLDLSQRVKGGGNKSVLRGGGEE